MLLAALVDTSRRVTESSGRNAKIGLIAELLSHADVQELPIAVAYLSGATRQGRTGIGWASLRELNTPAAGSPTLRLVEVDAALGQLAATEGAGAASSRRDLLRALFSRATEPEQRLLTGLLLGELRQGALGGLMIDAIAKAFNADPERVRRAVMLAGDAAPVAAALREYGERGLDKYSVQLFRPVQPMLAESAEDVQEALAQLGDAALEYKFDGARIQVHRSNDDIAVFTRRLNDVTAAVPEVVEAAKAFPARDFILDGEVLSFDALGRPQPFQVTARRFGRKLDLDRMRAELPLRPVWFDALYAEGGSIIDEPQSRRFETLKQIVPASQLVPHLFTSDQEEAAAFVERSLREGHEGVMAKAPGAPYAAGARGQAWLKVKRAKTLDLVILAAEWGNGRRQAWLSNLHLGARDVEKGGFAMLGKTFKGLTDQMLRWQTEEFQKIEIARDKYTVYLQPKIVAEIAFNDIQISPRYPSGLALRFARVKRYRLDKSPAECDTYQTVRQIAGLSQ